MMDRDSDEPGLGINSDEDDWDVWEHVIRWRKIEDAIYDSFEQDLPLVTDLVHGLLIAASRLAKAVEVMSGCVLGLTSDRSRRYGR